MPGSIVRFEHLTSEDGLSQNAGLEILQDSRGYLWVGSQDGLNNNAIAERLFVSLGTAKFHISNIFHKLGVSSRVEAVKVAIEQKLA